ncbi:hypothetical protein CAI16_14210 [Virgibacillus dokdonensis]|uniref:Uncharacterized protein n=1 Tax=Virgibacillus dokdonensis TaxID=302167 RepID=A0A3E0WKY8_9BACI|nr:hypothetical protein [Virgibacillus dokdonensis]RFA33624.1 hypothetical protein CAI16_14210 [Virgibacillus dokdonensis]
MVIKAIDPDVDHYEILQEETSRKRNYIRENRKAWLTEDPQNVIIKYREGIIGKLDLIRQYGVIIDFSTNTVLEKTTQQFREMLHKRSVAYWE